MNDIGRVVAQRELRSGLDGSVRDLVVALERLLHAVVVAICCRDQDFGHHISELTKPLVQVSGLFELSLELIGPHLQTCRLTLKTCDLVLLMLQGLSRSCQSCQSAGLAGREWPNPRLHLLFERCHPATNLHT